MRIVAHIICIVGCCAVFFGIPTALFANTSALAAALQGQTDVVSAATEIQEAPSGHFAIVINRNLHVDTEVLANWEVFLSGADAPLIMEDVSCVVAQGDTAGLELAENLQSRLPANQMTVRVEEGFLALSKAEAGRFDILVLSDEAATAFGAESLYRCSFADVIRR